MKSIVTGGAGFIGSHIADLLLEEGHEVIIFDNLESGFKKNIPKAAKFMNVDIAPATYDAMGFSDMKKAFEGVDYVFHLAALPRVQPSIDEPLLHDRVNTQGTLRMLKMAAKAKVKRFIFSSSSAIYGNVEEKNLPTDEDAETAPLSPYGAQKQIGEVYCKMFSQIYDLETVCLRYFNAFGERQSLDGAYKLVMGIFAKQLLEGQPMTITGDGKQRRDFVYVKDIAKANWNAATSRLAGKGEVINIGSGVNISVNELADLLEEVEYI